MTALILNCATGCSNDPVGRQGRHRELSIDSMTIHRKGWVAHRMRHQPP
jgi:hypothetical protein